MMEHYQSTSTPPPSVSSLPSRTPPVDRSASRREEECCLPPELCSICSHGIKVWILFLSLFSFYYGCLILFDVDIFSARALSRSFNPFGTNEEHVDSNIKWTSWRWYWSESWSYSRASSREVYIPIFFFLFSWLLKFSVLWRLWYITQQNLLGIMQQKEIRLKEVIDNASVSWVRVFKGVTTVCMPWIWVSF